MAAKTKEEKALLTTLRLPRELHAHLAAQAEQQGVSLNTWLVTLLAGTSGYRLPK